MIEYLTLLSVGVSDCAASRSAVLSCSTAGSSVSSHKQSSLALPGPPVRCASAAIEDDGSCIARAWLVLEEAAQLVAHPQRLSTSVERPTPKAAGL